MTKTFNLILASLLVASMVQADNWYVNGSYFPWSVGDGFLSDQTFIPSSETFTATLLFILFHYLFRLCIRTGLVFRCL